MIAKRPNQNSPKGPLIFLDSHYKIDLNGKHLFHAVPIEKVLDHILRQARAQTGSLMLLDSGCQVLKIAAAKGFSGDVIEEIKKMRLALGEGVAGHVCQTGKPYYVRSSKSDPTYVEKGASSDRDFQFLSLPLENRKGRAIGVLNIHFPNAKLLNAAELQELHRLASRLVSEELDHANA